MLAERLAEVTRAFGDAAVIGSGGGAYAAALAGRLPAARIVQLADLTVAWYRLGGVEVADGRVDLGGFGIEGLRPEGVEAALD